MSRKVLVLVLAMLGVAGCALNKSNLRQEDALTRIGAGGQIIEPKRCHLRVAILTRPLRDEAINAKLWSVADEQVVPPETQHAMEVNGLRLGVIRGELPHEVEAVLNAPAPHKIEPSQFEFGDGEFAKIALGESTSQVSLLLNRDGRAFGRDFQDACGWYRVTAKHEGTVGIELRFEPEIAHGPVQRTFGALPSTGVYAPQQFMQQDSQKVDGFRELAATLTLQPGQVAVLGCRAEANRSLGSFLFTQPEANSDRLNQRVVLLWASRGGIGLSESKPPGLVPVEPPKQSQSP